MSEPKLSVRGWAVKYLGPEEPCLAEVHPHVHETEVMESEVERYRRAFPAAKYGVVPVVITEQESVDHENA
jgi:hypothetical protein